MCAFPPLKGGRGDVLLLAISGVVRVDIPPSPPSKGGAEKEDKNVAIFKNDETVSAGVEEESNGSGGIIVVSNSTQTDFGRAI